MTDQWPKPKSLKDDPPNQAGRLLLFNARTGKWHEGISDTYQNLLRDGYTHWLPMPPDPPQPKAAWAEAFFAWTRSDPTAEDVSSYSFKAGWNAALGAVAKLDAQLQGEGCRYPMASAMEKGVQELKAP